MKSLNLNIPDEANLDPKEVTRFLAAKLYEAGRLTLAQAAKMVGLQLLNLPKYYRNMVFRVNLPFCCQ